MPTVKKVKITLPKTSSKTPDLFVSVNNETYLIKPGEEVEVPEYVYEEIRRAEKQKLSNMEKLEHLERK